ncbi:MAG: fibronectin type III domain-containing protein [Acidobacteria bacterium]|nr:fibronectin type III domain-containing protein [Acidobacteriota bacterium]
MGKIRPATVLGLAILAAAACGRKGPILEPLTRIPQPVASLAAGQRGATLRLRWTAPATYIDGRALPPDARTEIWLMRNAAAEAALPMAWEDEDEFTAKAVLLSVLDSYGRPLQAGTAAVPPPAAPPLKEFSWEREMTPEDGAAARLVFGVRVAAGRRGASKFAYAGWLPLQAPAPPGGLKARVFEDRIELGWNVPKDAAGTPPRQGFNVYRSSAGGPEVRLNETPVPAPPFADRTFRFGVSYAYRVSAVAGEKEPFIESRDSEALEVTPADSFPPARPKGLISVTAVGLITLSWDPGPETDLAGYRVWRKGPRETGFSLMTPAPISENTFTDDQVEAGGRYQYAVSALDRTGNESGRSEVLTETGKGAGS